MADRRLLGYDIGTMGSKGVIIDEGGRALQANHAEHGERATPSVGRTGRGRTVLG